MLNDYYQENAQRFFDQTVSVDMSELHRNFLELLPSPAKILDAGCGSGRDAKSFLDAGHAVTAFDASPAIVRLASAYIAAPVALLTFQKMEYEASFDGIWACASLLHVPFRELPEVFRRLRRALVDGGVLYASFKYGTGEVPRNGRRFTDMTELDLSQLLGQVDGFAEIRTWVSGDQRPGRGDEQWLNTLLRAEVLV